VPGFGDAVGQCDPGVRVPVAFETGCSHAIKFEGPRAMDKVVRCCWESMDWSSIGSWSRRPVGGSCTARPTPSWPAGPLTHPTRRRTDQPWHTYV
jgi:hypothetical protein